MNSVIERLTQALGSAQIRSGDSLSQRATSYWNGEPTCTTAIVFPRTTDEVSQIMMIFQSSSQAVVVQGGLTGCVSGAVSQKEEVILSVEKMNTIESVETIGSTATVQAGVILEVLKNNLADQGLIFPLDIRSKRQLYHRR